jgi:phenylpropionate dioxygenase-like ring-hydroxylating dioxygenase large terminal subunit
MKLISSNEWDCAFNWKVLAENFMESYHHAGAHSKTLQPMMPARDTWTEEEKPSPDEGSSSRGDQSPRGGR